MARRIRAESGDEIDEVYLYDVVGYWGITAGDFAKALKATKSKTVQLRINSPGGDVFEARAMVSAIRDVRAQGRTVVTRIDGLAASAASYIALAADKVVMTDGAFLMIHNAWGMTIGNAEEHRQVAELLDKVDASIRKDYAAKTGKTDEELAELMAAETWFTAEEALDAKFVDEIQGADGDEDEESDDADEGEETAPDEESDDEPADDPPPEEDEDDEEDGAAAAMLRAFKRAPKAVRRSSARKTTRRKPDSKALRAERDLREANERRLAVLELTRARA